MTFNLIKTVYSYFMLSSGIVEELWRIKEEKEEVYRVLVGKPEGKRQL